MSPAQIPGNAWSWNLTCKCSSVAKSCPYIFRPPYSCRQTRGFTAILSSSSSILFYLLFSSATLRADWTEPSQNRPNARKWVRFENVPNLGYTLSLQIGVQNHPFLMTSQLNGNFHSLYLRNETKTHIIGQMYWKLQWVSYIGSKSAVEKSGSSYPKNWGQKSFYICSVFRWLWDLMANVFCTKHDRTIGQESWKVQGVPYSHKISWTLVQKRLNI